MSALLNSIIIIFVGCSAVSITMNPNNDDLSTIQAISDIIDEFYSKKSLDFDFIIFDSENSRIIDKIGSSSNKLHPYQVKTVDNFDEWNQIDKSAVILVGNVLSVNNLNNEVKLTNFYSKDLIFLIILDEVFGFPLKLSAQPFLVNDYGRLLEFSYFLINYHDKIVLGTVTWFSQSKCDAPLFMPVNVMIKCTKQWLTSLKFFDKFRNLHGCSLTSGSIFNTLGTFYKDKFTSELRGIFFDLTLAIAQYTNFTAYFFPISNYTLSDDVNKVDETGDGRIQIVYKIRTNSLDSLEHVTMTFSQNSFIFVITPADPYTSYEKILLPFDTDTWTWLIITFSCTFVSIFIINRISKEVQDIVYGENVQTPTMNVFFIFFGIGQMRLPAKWFARFLLINFILFCLIFRTCYQSKMFEFMTSDMRKSSPETIDDLFVQNFKIYTMEFEHIVKILENLIDEKRR
ncbi:hypothetical protein ACKWTF_014688 [Chironomus riparius]